MRALVLLAAAAAAVLVVAGCGDTLSLDPVAKAADTSSQQSSEHMDMTATVQAQGKTITMTGGGDFQNKPVLGDMTMSISGNGSNLSMHEVMAGTMVYVSSGLFQRVLPAGKSWIAFDLEKAGKALGVDFASIETQSPTGTLAKLKASGKVTKVGTDTIGGIATTHYRATIDPAKVAKLTKKIGPVHYQPADVWVDDQGLVRRMKLDYTAAGAASDLTINLSNYDEPVNVTPPPSSETFDPTTTNGGTS